MSVDAIERALWQVVTYSEDALRLREDAESYFGQFLINEQERELLCSWKVNTLLGMGVHPMVLMRAYLVVHGPSDMRSYVEKIHQQD